MEAVVFAPCNRSTVCDSFITVCAVIKSGVTVRLATIFISLWTVIITTEISQILLTVSVLIYYHLFIIVIFVYLYPIYHLLIIMKLKTGLTVFFEMTNYLFTPTHPLIVDYKY